MHALALDFDLPVDVLARRPLERVCSVSFLTSRPLFQPNAVFSLFSTSVQLSF